MLLNVLLSISMLLNILLSITLPSGWALMQFIESPSVD